MNDCLGMTEWFCIKNKYSFIILKSIFLHAFLREGHLFVGSELKLVQLVTVMCPGLKRKQCFRKDNASKQTQHTERLNHSVSSFFIHIKYGN